MSPLSSAGITGIHHLTAIATDAQRTVDFYTQQLGLRLIEQSVDSDDPTADHLSFGDAETGPEMVSFVVKPGASRGRYGIGGVHHLAFETSDRATLRQWKRWLTDRGVPVTGPYDRVYFESIYFTDPDGLILEIATRGPGWTVDEAPAALGQEIRLPPPETTAGHRDEAAIAADIWPEPIAAPTPAMRLERMHHITAIGSDAEATEQFYSDLLGMRLVKRTVNFDDPRSPHLYWGVGAGSPGTIITYFAYQRAMMRSVQPGAGITHHFALSVPDDDALGVWRDELRSRGVPTSDIVDRGTDRRLTLRDPDGLLVSLATVPAGHQDNSRS